MNFNAEADIQRRMILAADALRAAHGQLDEAVTDEAIYIACKRVTAAEAEADAVRAEALLLRRVG